MAFRIRVQKAAWKQQGREVPVRGEMLRMPPEFRQMASGAPVATDFHVVLDTEDDGDFWVVSTRLAHSWETGEAAPFTPYSS